MDEKQNRTPTFHVFTLDLNAIEFVVAGKHINLSYSSKEQALDTLRKKAKK